MPKKNDTVSFLGANLALTRTGEPEIALVIPKFFILPLSLRPYYLRHKSENDNRNFTLLRCPYAGMFRTKKRPCGAFLGKPLRSLKPYQLIGKAIIQ